MTSSWDLVSIPLRGKGLRKLISLGFSAEGSRFHPLAGKRFEKAENGDMLRIKGYYVFPSPCGEKVWESTEKLKTGFRKESGFHPLAGKRFEKEDGAWRSGCRHRRSVSIPLRGKGLRKFRFLPLRTLQKIVSIPLRGKGLRKDYWVPNPRTQAGKVSIPLRGKGLRKSV